MMDWLYLIFLFMLTWFVIALIMIVLGDCDLLLQIAEKFGKSPSSLKNKVVWITGSSSGIGECLAYELSKVGCKLILSARRKDELERVRGQCIEKWGVKADDILVVPLDMVEFDTHAAAVEKVINKFGQVDILVNNAGRSQRAEWIKTSLEVDQQVLNVNVLGVLSLTKLVLPYMLKRNEGHIVNMSSIAGKIGAPFSGSYTGAKHAIQGWFDALRIEVLENNIAVTNLCPGPVFSNLLDIAFVGEAGKVLKQTMEPTDKRMKTTRCAELSAIAIANKLDECWIALNPVLFLTYANQYSPVLGKFVGKKFGLKIMKRLREGR
ncbi:dehydrogenase/reductase SDR family member 7-like [Mytilus galloprovincialis]|uniref:dehydrogenase/reductase SDR family member 7-like n=1 Tax=Mytilus galloprovincialis TaxID=29158 RepID=UPI003F7BBA7B